jgi:hypothetical protein
MPKAGDDDPVRADGPAVLTGRAVAPSGWLCPLVAAGPVVCALLAGCTDRQPQPVAKPPVASSTTTTLPQRSSNAWCDDPGVDCPASGEVPTSLRRPLRIPPKPAGGGCPRTTTTRRAEWGELLLGPARSIPPASTPVTPRSSSFWKPGRTGQGVARLQPDGSSTRATPYRPDPGTSARRSHTDRVRGGPTPWPEL